MHVVAIISQKGGAGKTTLATNIAVAGELGGYTAVLADLDTQGSGIAWSRIRTSNKPVAVFKTATELPAVLKVANEYDANLVVIDTPALSTRQELEILKHADLALIPCRASAPDLIAIGASVQLCRHARNPVYAVLSAVPTRGKLVEEALKALESYALIAAPQVICQRVAHVRAFAAGQSVLEYEPKGKAASEMRALYKWIILKCEEIKNAETAK